MQSPPVRYLTVQDVLWIHLQITGRRSRFRYAALEEATFQQYGYGRSLDIPAQAQRVLRAFIEHRPFDEGNAATGLVTALAFLAINGYDVGLDDQGLKRVVSSADGASGVPDLGPHIVQADESHHLDAETRTVVESILERYAETVSQLSSEVAA